MPRFWIGFVATCGVVVGTVFTCQLCTAAEVPSGRVFGGSVNGSRTVGGRSACWPRNNLQSR